MNLQKLFCVKIMVLCLLLLVPTVHGMAQTEVAISQTIDSYNGKSYYLHKVGAQQTLYSIAKAYGITVEGLLMENPDARRGLRTNQVLRIPTAKTASAEKLSPPPSSHKQPEGEDYEYVYHVAGRSENFKYLAEVYLIRETLIREANPGVKEPFTEGDYLLIPISKKEKTNYEPEGRYRRSTYDPYTTTTSTTSGTVTKRSLPAEKKVETVSPFDSPLQPVSPPSQKSSAEPRPEVASHPETPALSDVHIVKPGETIYSIAKANSINQEALLAANPGIGQNLRTGQVIRLPETKTLTAETTPTDTLTQHIVKKGETIYRISREYGVSIADLKKANPMLSETIAVGQKIFIPKKKITDNYLIHQVAERKKASSLAADYGLTHQELQKANPSMGKEVFPNQSIKIPLERRTGLQPLQPEPEAAHTSQTVATIESNMVAEQETDSINCEADPKNASKDYRIALLLPLYLEKVETLARQTPDDNNNTPLRFLTFYKGFMMAVDSMTRMEQLKTTIKVYDVDQSPEKTDRCLKDPWLETADLIVGPFHSQPFTRLAEYARDRHIMIVNPMSQRKEILDQNPYVVKIKPKPSAQLQQLASIIGQRYPNAKIFIYHSHLTKFAEDAKTLQSLLQNTLPQEVSISNGELSRRLRRNSDLSFQVNTEGKWLDLSYLQLNEGESTSFSNDIILRSYDQDSLRTFRKNGSMARDNIVIAFGDDRVFAMEFMNKLNQMAENMPVKFIGLPDWTDFDNLFNEILQRLDTHFSNDGFIAYDQPEIRDFVARYRQMWQTEPDNYAFSGFDIAAYFLQYLQKVGAGKPQCLPAYPASLLHTHFHFQTPEKDSGTENTYWDFYRFENYTTTPLRNSYFYP